MQLQELYRDIGKIVQVEYREGRTPTSPGSSNDNHRRIGYIKSISLNSLTLAECDPKQELQKKQSYRKDYFESWSRAFQGFYPLQLSPIEATGIKKIEEISPLEITAENIFSLRVGIPIQFQYRGSTGVAHVREITPEKVVVDAFDPTIESHKNMWHNISYRASFPLMELLPNARPVLGTAL